MMEMTMSERKFLVIACFMQIACENILNGGESVVSSRFYLVLICAILVLFAAFMNYRESVSASWTNYLMFIGAVGMFIAAGMLYKQEKP
jgi:hypothetical protein